MSMKFWLAGFAAVALTGAASAASNQIVIPLPMSSAVDTVKVTYACDGIAEVEVAYINAPPVSLATLSFNDDFVVMANVLAASGAKYAGDHFIWWTKGNGADLYDLTKGENAPPIKCRQAP
ncbi:MAG TPA: MliC family protein [Ancylobacter sp.]